MTVLVAIAGSNGSERILKEGAQLATQFEDDLEIVHVMTRSEFVSLERTSVSETDEPVDIDKVRTVAADVGRELATGVIDDFSVVGLVGDPAAEVVSHAKKRNARYVVVGVRKRSAVGKAVFGSTAQKILMNSECSVLAVPRIAVDQ